MNPYHATVQEIAAERGLSAKEILTEKPGREPIAEARQEAYWRLRQRNNSYPKIARWAGRHHTSIMFGVRAHEQRMAAQ